MGLCKHDTAASIWTELWAICNIRTFNDNNNNKGPLSFWKFHFSWNKVNQPNQINYKHRSCIIFGCFITRIFIAGLSVFRFFFIDKAMKKKTFRFPLLKSPWVAFTAQFFPLHFLKLNLCVKHPLIHFAFCFVRICAVQSLQNSPCYSHQQSHHQ